MALTRSQIAKQLLPGLNTVFGMEYKDVDGEHLPLFDIETSEKAFEEEVQMTGFGPAPDKSEGAAVVYDNATEGYTSRYTHSTVALAYAITEEAMEDNLYATEAKIKAKFLGRSMADTLQIKGANIYNNGFSASYLGGDGVALFSAAHPTVGAGNQTNTVSADLSETALENALIAISQYEDDRGILMALQASSLHIPPQLQCVAERILKTQFRTGTADNDINAINSIGFFSKGYSVNHRFTDTNAWHIRTDCPDGPKMFDRVPLQTRMEGDQDFDTGNMRYKARQRYSFGWSDWRGLYGSDGSS